MEVWKIGRRWRARERRKGSQDGKTGSKEKEDVECGVRAYEKTRTRQQVDGRCEVDERCEVYVGRVR